ncbi:DNA alkylation repair protein [Pseudanabaena minima]|uniref:DNA alkylation repair protein n=1 Tax=Pseudanabaena minima TaxID=890415 RepID=UPI003DA7BB60
MSYLIHRAGDRLVLENTLTGALVGLMVCPSPNESRRMFEYDFGSTESRNSLVNVDGFPELDYLQFYGVESLDSSHYALCYRDQSWQHLRHLFYAEGKAIGFNANKSPSGSTINPIWQHTPTNEKGSWKLPAWALYANHQGVWMGNRDGLVIAFDHQGQISNQFQLPKITRCLIANEQSIYATCDDGNLYDLGGKLPRAVYNARSDAVSIWYDFLIYGLDYDRDRFHIIDFYGRITQLDAQLQLQWQKQVNQGRSWFFQADDYAIYQGHNQGVSAYAIASGKLLWSCDTAAVLCGVLTEDTVIVGTSDCHIYELSKTGDIKAKNNEIKIFAVCDGAPYACAISEDQQVIFVADHQGGLYAFNRRGDKLWQQSLSCGVILSMCCVGDRLYGTTTEGTILCLAIPSAMPATPITPPPQHLTSMPSPSASIPKRNRRKQEPAPISTLSSLQTDLQALANPQKAIALARYFQTGQGQYAEGDRFLGITMPEQRKLAKKYRDLGFVEISELLSSEWHEYRLTGLLILTYQFAKATPTQQQAIVDFYLANTHAINNWDLVDVTCQPILGMYLLQRDRQILYQLANSASLWEQRIAIVTTGKFIKHGQYQDTIAIAELLLQHPHHLIHKAVGWMLREVGKQDRSVLLEFLDQHASQMPRVMLRYAIEHFDQPQRQAYLQRSALK